MKFCKCSETSSHHQQQRASTHGGGYGGHGGHGGNQYGRDKNSHYGGRGSHFKKYGYYKYQKMPHGVVRWIDWPDLFDAILVGDKRKIDVVGSLVLDQITNEPAHVEHRNAWWQRMY